MNRWIATLAATVAGPIAAAAATLQVGPGQSFAEPSQAVARAHDGDTIAISPGQYFDCAVVRQSHLTIEGVGEGAVLTDKPCQGKALLVIDGKDVTIRNLTLQRARVPDGNGAGIRAEGGDLSVENTRFINNQNGILSASNPEATIRILGSTFIGNGVCTSNCAHAVYVNHIKLLDVERSRFIGTHQGHAIKSRALTTRVIGCDIEDGPDGTLQLSDRGPERRQPDRRGHAIGEGTALGQPGQRRDDRGGGRQPADRADPFSQRCGDQ